MPAGITHLTLAREALDHLSSDGKKAKKILARHLGPFLVGTITPDIPYLGKLSSSPFTNNKEIADDLHYKKTNELPLKGLEYAKNEFKAGNREFAEALYAFYMGYSSHLIADGIIHPFVRDYVGDYEVAADDHRILEMKLDVLVANRFLSVEMNGVSLQDNLSWMEDSEYKMKIYKSFSDILKSVHGHDLTPQNVQSLVYGLTRGLNIAEGRYPRWYTLLAGENGYSYMYLADLLPHTETLTTVLLPVDAKEKGLKTNFMGTAYVNFFDHVVPQFFKVLPPRIEAAYEYVFNDGPTLETLIPLINLDTGRPVNTTDLNQKPTLWA